MLHSALLQAVYKITDTVPGPEDIFGSRSAIDLRNGWMPPPYNEKRQYVNSAIVIQRIEVPCLLFSQENGFWEASKYIAKLWEAVRERKGMVATIESEAAAFLGAIKQQRHVTFRFIVYPVLTSILVPRLHQQSRRPVRTSSLIHQDLKSLSRFIQSLEARICSFIWSRTS